MGLKTITLAGQEYELRYGPESPEQIEDARDKSLMACMQSGMRRDQAAVIWAGIKHTNKKLTVEGVLALMRETEEYDPMLRRCYRALLSTAPFGRKLDETVVARFFGKDEDDDEDASGKGEPAATGG